jgi:hypothetical protein
MSLAKPGTSLAKLAIACVFAAVTLSACGITAKPEVGTPHINSAPGNHAVFDDPRTTHTHCLRQIGLGIRKFRAAGGVPAIQVGRLPTGPTIYFYPVSNIQSKIEGQAQGSIMIGSALVYPNRATTKVADRVIYCIDQGVPG